MLASKYNTDRQPEMSMWPSKPEIITSLELWQIESKYPRQIRDFWWCRARQRISQIIATTTNCHKLRDWWAKRPRPYCNLRLSVVVAIAKTPSLAWSKTQSLPSELQWYLSYCPYCRRNKYFRFGWPHCHFRLSVYVAFICVHFLRLWRGR